MVYALVCGSSGRCRLDSRLHLKQNKNVQGWRRCLHFVLRLTNPTAAHLYLQDMVNERLVMRRRKRMTAMMITSSGQSVTGGGPSVLFEHSSCNIMVQLVLATNLRDVFTITEKASTRGFSWLKAPTIAFTFKTLLRRYAKRALTFVSASQFHYYLPWGQRPFSIVS